jgi:uncharacterized protein YjiS (DUF1127 family)
MPNPKSGTFDLGGGPSTLVPPRLTASPQAARLASRFGNTVRELLTRYLAWKAKRDTVRALSSLDPAILHDLGITDIESTVYGDPHDRIRSYDPYWWRAKCS